MLCTAQVECFGPTFYDVSYTVMESFLSALWLLSFHKERENASTSGLSSVLCEERLLHYCVLLIGCLLGAGHSL